MGDHIIGIDFGTGSARGVLVDVETGRDVAAHVHAYKHGTMTRALPNGRPLADGWALQVGDDDLDAAGTIPAGMGRGRRVLGLGIGFTASSAMPCGDGSMQTHRRFLDDPHAQ